MPLMAASTLVSVGPMRVVTSWPRVAATVASFSELDHTLCHYLLHALQVQPHQPSSNALPTTSCNNPQQTVAVVVRAPHLR